MQLAQRILVVLRDTLGADQAARRRCDFVAKRLEMPRLRGISLHPSHSIVELVTSGRMLELSSDS